MISLESEHAAAVEYVGVWAGLIALERARSAEILIQRSPKHMGTVEILRSKN